MTYAQSLDYIAGLEKRGWRLGLDRMQEFARLAQIEQHGFDPYRIVHVAGTNGKGSVTEYVQQILKAHGVHVGGFFSPFVYSIRERIQLDASPISEMAFAEAATVLQPIADGMVSTEFGGPTEFEFKTAMGLHCWKREQCAWVALEVGLGGRLDATNIVDPACSVIVSIGHDHMEFLGDTLEKVATEKAGIIKPGKPAVVGKVDDENARNAIRRIAREADAELWEFGNEIQVSGSKLFEITTPAGRISDIHPGIPGAVQPHNLALAVAALQLSGFDLDPDAARRGAAAAKLPGRYQVFPWRERRFVLDGAHNWEASLALAIDLESDPEIREPVVLITAMLQGHDIDPFYRPLAPRVERAFVPPVDFHRSRDPQDLSSAIRQSIPQTRPCRSVSEAVQYALAACRPGQTIVVTGSFYLVGEVGRLIGADAL